MMNTNLPYLPERTSKNRNSGLTMMMDKGLSLMETENFIDSSAEYTDLVKFGFGTSVFSPNLKEKIKLYKSADITPYFGGTLFEAYMVRGLFDDYKRFVEKFGLDTVEVSDGSMKIDHYEKLKCIDDLCKNFRVLSEVGSKVQGVELSHNEWVQSMKTEIEAGAWKVIAEARESGTIGIYNSDGSADGGLIDDIIKHVAVDDILWEAPIKSQQVYFINLIGANVSLGNIAPNEVISLEALRLGLRGDTFFNFLPEKFQDKKL
jgi:phosphosulfolactate synthase